MEPVFGGPWQRHGTSLIWSVDALQEVANDQGLTVSLRQALDWAEPGGMPDNPPDAAGAVVVTGLLETLDLLTADQAQALLKRVRALVRAQTHYWPEAALVFSIRDGSRLHVSPATGTLVVRLAGGEELDIGRALWGGVATEAEAVPGPTGRRAASAAIGYWLRHVS